ncbi:hypothetical protein J6590_080179 [Homalodisca vitripennis]|nr:hypothetical protein J6590_080179 [Homalodisca vitripennis]
MGTLRVLLTSVFVCFTKVTADAQCPCVSQQDCPADQSCIEQICESPCPSLCGNFTICQVDDHIASCYCEPGYSGDPYIGCYDQYDIGNWPPYHATTKRYTVEPVTVSL